MSRCRECNHANNAAMRVDDVGRPVPPVPGAVAICIYCGCLSIATGRGIETRPPTVAEAAELEADIEIAAAQAAAAVYRDDF